MLKDSPSLLSFKFCLCRTSPIPKFIIRTYSALLKIFELRCSLIEINLLYFLKITTSKSAPSILSLLYFHQRVLKPLLACSGMRLSLVLESPQILPQAENLPTLGLLPLRFCYLQSESQHPKPYLDLVHLLVFYSTPWLWTGMRASGFLACLRSSLNLLSCLADSSWNGGFASSVDLAWWDSELDGGLWVLTRTRSSTVSEQTNSTMSHLFGSLRREHFSELLHYEVDYRLEQEFLEFWVNQEPYTWLKSYYSNVRALDLEWN